MKAPALTIAVVAMLASAKPGAQTRAPAVQTPVFRGGTDLIPLNVSVYDKAHHPVRGLTAADFTIRVDGVIQSIVALTEVDVPDASATVSPTPSDLRTNGPADPRVWILVMDDAYAPADPFMIKAGKAIARAFISRLGPSDVAAVLFPWNEDADQDFTADHASLLAAVDTFSPGPAFNPTEVFDSLPAALISTLETARDVLASLSPRRTAVVYIGTGTYPTLPPEYRARLRALGQSRGAASVPFYSFSIAGLMAQGARFGPGDKPVFSSDDAKKGTAVLQDLAGSTNGFVVSDTNSPAAQVARVLEDNDTYYEIGYTPTYPLEDGHYRRLEIRVNHPGMTVVPGDRAIESVRPPAPRAVQPLLKKALSGLLPDARTPLRVSVVPIAAQNGATDAAVVLGVQLPPAADSAHVPEKLDLMAVVFDVRQKKVSSWAETATIAPGPPSNRSRAYDFLFRMPVPPGRYSVRVAMENSTLETGGSVYADLIIPDFSHAPLALSGVALAATPAPIAAPRDGLAGLLPLVPTSVRQFARADSVRAFVRVYQAAAGPPVAVGVQERIVDASGRAVLDRMEMLQATRFAATRSADVVLDLPVATLAPGDYTLSFAAAVGQTTASRDVEFSVR